MTQPRSALALKAAGSSSPPFSCGSEFRALACPHFGPQFCWQAVVMEGDVVKPQCLVPCWVFNIATTMWPWTPCLSARSQKCCVCCLLNSCGFGRNVAGWGDACGVCWGSHQCTAQARQETAQVMCIALLPSVAALPLAYVESWAYSWTLSPDTYKPRPRGDLLETCGGGILAEEPSFPAQSPAQHHCQ